MAPLVGYAISKQAGMGGGEGAPSCRARGSGCLEPTGAGLDSRRGGRASASRGWVKEGLVLPPRRGRCYKRVAQSQPQQSSGVSCSIVTVKGNRSQAPGTRHSHRDIETFGGEGEAEGNSGSAGTALR